MNFSIVIPSRERHTLLIRLLDSIQRTVCNISQIECLLMIDDDDLATLNILTEYILYNPYLQIIIHQQKQNKFINDNYYNKGAKLSKGKYIWGLGNDCEIITQNWDILLYRKIEEYLVNKLDRLCYVYIDDDKHKNPKAFESCSFPVFTREVLETLDCLMPSEITSFGADHWAWQNFKKLDGINRILDLRQEIGILHYSHHTNRIPQDNISSQLYNNNGRSYLTQGEEAVYINKLKKRINQFQ